MFTVIFGPVGFEGLSVCSSRPLPTVDLWLWKKCLYSPQDFATGAYRCRFLVCAMILHSANAIRNKLQRDCLIEFIIMGCLVANALNHTVRFIFVGLSFSIVLEHFHKNLCGFCVALQFIAVFMFHFDYCFFVVIRIFMF
jgi:hypothetical protein